MTGCWKTAQPIGVLMIKKCTSSNPRACLRLIGAVILLVGLGSAALIYVTSRDRSGSVPAYENGGQLAYRTSPEDSKQYLRSLELYGGTANVLANELRLWFDGLWHGRTLAFTVACIAIVISSGIFYAANHLVSRSKESAQGENGSIDG